MTRWSMAGVVAVMVASVAVAAPMSPAAAADAPDVWSAPFGDQGNSGVNAGETALDPKTAPNVSARWSRTDAATVDAPPAVVDGVGYQVVNPAATTEPARFQAFSVATGTKLWTLTLPTDGRYRRGVSVVGSVAVMPFDGQTKSAGVTAVGLTSRRVLWSKKQATAGDPASGGNAKKSGPVVVDFARVYMLGATNTVNTFDLVDGSAQWRVETTSASALPWGIALYGDAVYTGGAAGVIAYDSETGARLWKAPGVGAPVATGGRVITAAGSRVVAVAAAGCNGRTTCSALWDVTLPYPNMSGTAIGGVDGVNGYLVYTDTVRDTGGLVRFGAVTGKVLWRAPVAPGAVRPVRGASTVWTVAGGNTLLGFSVKATASSPLVSILEPAALRGAGQRLGIAAGTVFVRSNSRQLAAYGLPAA